MLVLCFFFLTIQQIYIFEEAAFVHIFNYFFYNRRFLESFPDGKSPFYACFYRQESV